MLAKSTVPLGNTQTASLAKQHNRHPNPQRSQSSQSLRCGGCAHPLLLTRSPSFQLTQGSELYKIQMILYTLLMSDISISDAREGLSAAVNDSQKKPVRILKHGKPVAVLINPSMFERFIESMEELEDIAAFDAAISDRSPLVPWSQVKKDLGIA